MSRIRLVVSDLDHTLLAPDRSISEEAKALIRTIRQRGYRFTFITGRPPYAVRSFAEQLAIAEPIVCCNGAVLVDGETIVARNSFPVAPLEHLMVKAAGLGITVLMYAGDEEYALAETDWVRTRRKAGKSFPLYRPESGLIRHAEKVNFIADGEEAKAAFLSLHPEMEALRETYTIALYGAAGCEIVAAGIDKGSGLRQLCERLSVLPEEVLAIGDDVNDCAMLACAGIGAAVANAVAPVKERADYCCLRPYTEGVMEAIERYCREDREACN